MKKNDQFGINMKQFCRDHEAELAAQEPSPELLEKHLRKLAWLQHERLIHLIVVVMTVIGELFAADLAILHEETNPWAALFMLGLAVLLGFYFMHYFFLENTVQRWYHLAEKMEQEMKL